MGPPPVIFAGCCDCMTIPTILTVCISQEEVGNEEVEDIIQFVRVFFALDHHNLLGFLVAMVSSSIRWFVCLAPHFLKSVFGGQNGLKQHHLCKKSAACLGDVCHVLLLQNKKTG